MPEKSEVSIIEIIRKMVAEGESEEKIIRTLKDLGVEESKAKRLLLLGQADTYALLKGEIHKIVVEDVNAEKAKLIEFIKTETEKSAAESRKKTEQLLIKDLKRYEKDITGQSRTFQEQISDTVRKFTELSERVRIKLNELGAQVHKVQVDMDELRLKGVGARNRLISVVLIVLGILFCGMALFLFYTKFGAALSVDAVIITVVMALVGITMLFVATMT